MTRRSATVSGMRKRRRSKVAKVSTKKHRRKSTPIAEVRAQMSAASRILELVGRSPSDLQPVFDAIAENARELTGALYSGLTRLEDGLVKVEATCGWEDEALAAINRSYPRPAGRDNLLAAAIIDGEVQNVADILASDANYTSEVQAISGYRSMLVVPMMRGQNPIGAICVFSRQVGVFQQSHIDLLKTFAAQAVIAIENTRLFNESRSAHLRPYRAHFRPHGSARAADGNVGGVERLSQARRESCSRCSTPCWTRRCGFAGRMLQVYSFMKTAYCAAPPVTALSLMRLCQSRPAQNQALCGRLRLSKSFASLARTLGSPRRG
jgi:transcriptional regulator with GAF, ATPase, and Fis domain